MAALDQDPSGPLSHLTQDARGATYIEYLVLLSLVTLLGAAAIAGLGLPLLRLFQYAEVLVSLPIP